MSSIHPALRPYLNHRYWGHSLFDGDATPLRPLPASPTEQLRAAHALGRLTGLVLLSAAQTVISGETFSAAEWPHGTIVRFGHEVLFAANVSPSAPIDKYADEPLPEPLTTFGCRQTFIDDVKAGSGLAYMRSSFWGVVTQSRVTRRGTTQLYGFAEGDIPAGLNQPKAQLSQNASWFHNGFTVGKTIHSKLSNGETMERFSEVVVYGRNE